MQGRDAYAGIWARPTGASDGAAGGTVRVGLRLDVDPAAVARAATRGDRRDAAVALVEGRERRVVSTRDRRVDLREEIAEGLAVALRVPGGVAGKAAAPTPSSSRDP